MTKRRTLPGTGQLALFEIDNGFDLTEAARENVGCLCGRQCEPGEHLTEPLPAILAIPEQRRSRSTIAPDEGLRAWEAL